jgi:hypothetical protein
MTMVALDSGEKPSVISAICKYHMTERMRSIINDAMDIHGGKGIMMGPNNYLGHAYMTVPIAITVEGANILTRSMIIFGQGAIRCHPFVQDEIMAIAENSLPRFDKALFGHINFVAMCAVRSLLLGLTGGRLAASPSKMVDLGRFAQHLSRFSAAFALVSDTAMGTLGGSLKRREKISGRLADALGWMYLASAILKRYYADKGGLNEGRLRMARVPKGAVLIPNPVSGAPGIQIANLFLMAGVPHITAGMLEGLTGTLEGGRPLVSATIGGFIPESEVAGLLADAERAHEGVAIGSYPFFRDGRVGSNFVIRSEDEGLARTVAARLAEAMAAAGWETVDGGL